MIIKDVSLVVIARNEEFAISKCIKSLSLIEFDNCEIIFVDSDSSDDTLKLMQDAKNNIDTDVKIFQCKGQLNAAKSRNVGARIATKKYVFFSDGDTEINSHFIKHALIKFEADSDISAVTGQLSEQVYSDNYNEKIRFINDRYNIDHEFYTYKSGGNIFVKRRELENIGYWNERLIVNEDLDLCMRLSRSGKILAIPIPIGTHHTLEYTDRTILYTKKLYPKFFGYLIRANFLHTKGLKALLKANKGVSIGILYLFVASITVLLVTINHNFLFLLPLCMILGLDLIGQLLKRKNIVRWLIIRFIQPVIVLGGFIFYYPSTDCCNDFLVDEIVDDDNCRNGL